MGSSFAVLVSWGGGWMSKDLIFLPLDYKIKSNFEVMKVEFVLKASGTITSVGHSASPRGYRQAPWIHLGSPTPGPRYQSACTNYPWMQFVSFSSSKALAGLHNNR